MTPGWIGRLCLPVIVLAASVSAAAQSFRDTPDAVQSIYRDGVPHTDRTGELRFAYEPGRSFFPIGMYHALDGEFTGVRYSFADLAALGINTVVPWRDQPLDQVIAAARRSRLQVIWDEPTAADLASFANDPAILGWDVDHEPSVAEPGAAADARLARFLARRTEIRAASDRPVFTVNSPSVSEPRTALWSAWAGAGDLVAFWKYPFFGPPVETLTGPRGVPDVTQFAVRAVQQRKPVLYVAQAFSGQELDWRFPDPAQARAMIYAALVHGATGVIWFAEDSFVTRNDGVLGAYPAPRGDYGRRLPGSRVVPQTKPEAELAGSRRMWETVGRIDRELAALAPALLSPTSDRAYTVAVSGWPLSAAPIRTLLKRDGDDLVLLAVNVDAVRLTARFDFTGAVRDIRRVFDENPAPTVDSARWTDPFGPFEVRIYRLTAG
jgi:hypothetical protein